MKSVKLGRGFSVMGAGASIVIAIFGIFWTLMTVFMGAPIFFPIFGVIFVGLSIFIFFTHYNNATGKKRISIYDIIDSDEEDKVFEDFINNDKKFCPYCGTPLDSKYKFCPNCGKSI